MIRALVLAATLPLGACATLPRVAYSPAEAAMAQVPGIPGARFFLDEPTAAARMVPPRDPPGGTITLALSSGGDDGAFAVGFLKGWTQTGTRPEFTVVTGVSTGALVAPFAFLGPQWDDTVARVFTGLSPRNVMKLRFPLAIPGSTSVFSARPLEELIAANVTDSVIDAVAAEHIAGRQLFVETANIDAQRAMVWDMGAIAASATPGRYALFRRVLLASGSLPGVFPPVPITVAAMGRTFQELHIDGGTASQILTPPGDRGQAIARRANARLYMISSSQWTGGFRVVNAYTVPVIRNAYGLALRSALQAQVTVAFHEAHARGATARLAYIAQDFRAPPHVMFANWYLRSVYDYGLAKGRAQAWVDSPPDARAFLPPAR